MGNLDPWESFLEEKNKIFQEDIEFGHFLNVDIKIWTVNPWPNIKDKIYLKSLQVFMQNYKDISDCMICHATLARCDNRADRFSI